ncbi:MAG: hypothetical protein ACLRNQ_10470 [Flavonifractor plautii]
MVRKALQYAVKNGLVDGNVADQVDRPKKGKYLAGFYTREELAALFEATKDDSISVVIQLAAYYGLRRGEVLGIRWSAIDDEKGTLSINHKVTEGMVDGRHQIYTEDKLKTKSSFRTLPLIPAVRALAGRTAGQAGGVPAAVQEVLLHRIPGLRVYRRDGQAVPPQLHHRPL